MVAASNASTARGSVPIAWPWPARGQGIHEPVAAWTAEGVSASESRFEAVHATDLTDLIGREREFDFPRERQRLAWNRDI